MNHSIFKTWLIPSDNSQFYSIDEDFFMPTIKMYNRWKLKIKHRRVSDVVEELIGAYFSSGGEVTALSFMKWIGMEIGLSNEPLPRRFPVNIQVLGYAVIIYLYCKYLILTQGFITDLRSAFANNKFYTQFAFNVSLHKHIFHASQELQWKISSTIKDFRELDLVFLFGWGDETTFPMNSLFSDTSSNPRPFTRSQAKELQQLQALFMHLKVNLGKCEYFGPPKRKVLSFYWYNGNGIRRYLISTFGNDALGVFMAWFKAFA
ncbi:hypothetical protein BC332_18736 [Capsicum chinense]|nr:hypothetical protein BC332_18736 [Capsicum chinense]